MVAAPASSTPRRRTSLARRHSLWGLLFVAPTFLMLTVFVLVPSVIAIYLSFTNWHLVGAPVFVGLQNYADLLEDSAFFNALTVTFLVAFGIAIPGSVISLTLGLSLTAVSRGRALYQAIFYTPLVVPSVVAGIVWGVMYAGNGVINTLLGTSIPWLVSPQWALIAILLVMLWTSVGYYTILMFAGLQDISPEIIEAAATDGAGPFQRLRHIILPLMRPVLLFVIVVATIEALTMFAQPFLLTKGGPDRATETLALYIYQTAFSFSNIGKASALAVVLLVIATAFAVVQFRVFRRSDV